MTRAADYLSRLYEMLAGYHTIYMDRIRGDNPKAFTRKRKALPLTVTVQILTQRGKAQRSEVDTVMRSIGADIEITDVGFYKARMKFDPEAIRRMSYDFVDSEMLRKRKLGSSVHSSPPFTGDRILGHGSPLKQPPEITQSKEESDLTILSNS